MSEDKDKRKGWLRALVPGDKVVWGGVTSYSSKHVGEVVRITPTGRIVVRINEGGYTETFAYDGYQRRKPFHNSVQIYGQWYGDERDNVKDEPEEA